MNRKYIWGVLTGLAVALLATAPATAQQMSLQKVVVGSGGGTASDGVTTMEYTIGQPVVGTASNGTQTATFGFWNETLQVASVSAEGGAGMVTGLNVSPNPIATTGEVTLTLARAGNVEVLLYNSAGQLESTLFNGTHEAGTLQLELESEGLTSGAYFIAVRVPGALIQQPISIVK